MCITSLSAAVVSNTIVQWVYTEKKDVRSQQKQIPFQWQFHHRLFDALTLLQVRISMK